MSLLEIAAGIGHIAPSALQMYQAGMNTSMQREELALAKRAQDEAEKTGEVSRAFTTSQTQTMDFEREQAQKRQAAFKHNTINSAFHDWADQNPNKGRGAYLSENPEYLDYYSKGISMIPGVNAALDKAGMSDPKFEVVGDQLVITGVNKEGKREPFEIQHSDGKKSGVIASINPQKAMDAIGAQYAEFGVRKLVARKGKTVETTPQGEVWYRDTKTGELVSEAEKNQIDAEVNSELGLQEGSNPIGDSKDQNESLATEMLSATKLVDQQRKEQQMLRESKRQALTKIGKTPESTNQPGYNPHKQFDTHIAAVRKARAEAEANSLTGKAKKQAAAALDDLRNLPDTIKSGVADYTDKVSGIYEEAGGGSRGIGAATKQVLGDYGEFYKDTTFAFPKAVKEHIYDPGKKELSEFVDGWKGKPKEKYPNGRPDNVRTLEEELAANPNLRLENQMGKGEGSNPPKNRFDKLTDRQVQQLAYSGALSGYSVGGRPGQAQINPQRAAMREMESNAQGLNAAQAKHVSGLHSGVDYHQLEAQKVANDAARVQASLMQARTAKAKALADMTPDQNKAFEDVRTEFTKRIKDEYHDGKYLGVPFNSPEDAANTIMDVLTLTPAMAKYFGVRVTRNDNGQVQIDYDSLYKDKATLQRFYNQAIPVLKRHNPNPGWFEDAYNVRQDKDAFIRAVVATDKAEAPLAHMKKTNREYYDELLGELGSEAQVLGYIALQQKLYADGKGQ